jgi:hypothetical protein
MKASRTDVVLATAIVAATVGTVAHVCVVFASCDKTHAANSIGACVSCAALCYKQTTQTQCNMCNPCGGGGHNFCKNIQGNFPTGCPSTCAQTNCNLPLEPCWQWTTCMWTTCGVCNISSCGSPWSMSKFPTTASCCGN